MYYPRTCIVQNFLIRHVESFDFEYTLFAKRVENGTSRTECRKGFFLDFLQNKAESAHNFIFFLREGVILQISSYFYI